MSRNAHDILIERHKDFAKAIERYAHASSVRVAAQGRVEAHVIPAGVYLEE